MREKKFSKQWVRALTFESRHKLIKRRLRQHAPSHTPDAISFLGNIRVIRCIVTIRKALTDRAHHTPDASEVTGAGRVLVGKQV